VLQCAELLLVAWLPGALLFRVPAFDREHRARLDAEERAFWAVLLSVTLSVSLVFGLAVFHRYSFHRLLVADAALSGAILLLFRSRLRLGATAARPGLTAILPLVLVVLGAVRFFPTAEYVMAGKDPGTYVNEGVQIAQRGAIVTLDRVVAEVPPFARDLFFPSHQRPEYYGTRFMGFFLLNPDTGAVIGQFHHFFPASLAIGYGIDGLNGVRRAVGTWAILGLLAVYFAGARLFGRAAACAACVLLALQVIEVWFARYPNSEMPMQALLFAGLLANARAHVDGDRFFAPVAGVLFGALLFLRIDAAIAVAALGVSMALAAFAGQRPRVSFLAPLLIAGALSVAYVFGPLRAYVLTPLYFLQELPWWQHAAFVLAVAAGIAALAFGSRRPRLSAFVVRWIPIALAAVTVLAAAYALWLRQPVGRLALMDAYALRMFTNWYLTLPGLVAALVGLVLFVRRGFWRDPAFLVTAIGFSLFVFYKIRIVPEHFWMTRRFIPVVLPAALLFASFAAVGGTRDGWRGARRLRPLLGWIFLALVGASYARASRPVASHVEYQGMIPRLEKLAGLIGDDDLAIVESRNAGSDMHTLGLPLAYIYARNVLVLNSARPDKATFAEFLEWAHTRYSRILFIGAGGTDLLSYRYGVRAVSSERFQVPEYDSPINDYPKYVRHKEFDFGVFEFTPPQRTSAPWFDLDVGVNDDLYVLRFHAKEKVGTRTFRWTRANSFISVATFAPGAREVTVVMSNGSRAASAPPATVGVYLHGQLLGTATVTKEFLPYTFPIPADLAARAAAYRDPVELKFASTLWNPHEALGGPDDRDLGVMVDRVAVR
jgi:hypothetical protein